MNKTEIRNIIEEAKNKNLLCKINFKYNDYNFYCIPLICDLELFLCTEEDDFMLDGYTIRRYKDIKSAELSSDKHNKILKGEGITVDIPEIEIDNWHSAFKSLKKRNKNIIIEKESLNDEESDFVIGRIIEVNKTHASVYNFNIDGIWDERINILFKEITSITFGSRYVDVFSKYIDEPISIK